MIRPLVLLTALGAVPAVAQDNVITSPIDGSTVIIPDIAADAVRGLRGTGASLRGLDKLSGEVTDIALASGEAVAFGRIEVILGECRYPEDNPTGEAYAWLTIRDPRLGTDLFDGWMIASSPALNALDHSRYDVWVIRCTTA